MEVTDHSVSMFGLGISPEASGKRRKDASSPNRQAGMVCSSKLP